MLRKLQHHNCEPSSFKLHKEKNVLLFVKRQIDSFSIGYFVLQNVFLDFANTSTSLSPAPLCQSPEELVALGCQTIINPQSNAVISVSALYYNSKCTYVTNCSDVCH